MKVLIRKYQARPIRDQPATLTSLPLDETGGKERIKRTPTILEALPWLSKAELKSIASARSAKKLSR
jgi:hypothetical protein